MFNTGFKLIQPGQNNKEIDRIIHIRYYLK